MPAVSALGSDPVRPDWYPDPTGRHELRYHNGVSWTGDVATDGQRWVDPLDGPSGHVGHQAEGPPNGHAVAALTCGIIAVSFGWLPVLFAVGGVLAVLAIVFGASGLRRARAGARGRSLALAGLLTGIGGLLVSAGGLVFTIVLLRALDEYENPAEHSAELIGCTITPDAVELAGTVRNDGDRPAEFTVAVTVVRGGSGLPLTTLRQRIGPLEPGATADWSARRPVVIDADVADGAECQPPQVNGPLPFGVVPPG